MLRFAYTPVIDRDHRAKNRGFSETPGSGRTLQWSVAKSTSSFRPVSSQKGCIYRPVFRALSMFGK